MTITKPRRRQGRGRKPDLEVLRYGPTKTDGRPPLLFVHGAFSAAWIWEEHMMPWFAERGWSVSALSFRGHGESPGRRKLHEFGVADYVDDLASAVAEFNEPPVLIGHSMGGFVIQKFLERGRARALVLMASVPPSGLAMPAAWLAFTHPGLFWEIAKIQACGERYITVDMLKDAVFREDTPHATVARYIQRFQNESARATMDCYGPWLPYAAPFANVPVLVLGAGGDRLVASPHVRATAMIFGVQPVIFEEMGHAMMLDPEWQSVASTMQDWLAANVLT